MENFDVEDTFSVVNPLGLEGSSLTSQGTKTTLEKVEILKDWTEDQRKEYFAFETARADKELAIEREKTARELVIEREKTARAVKELEIEREKTARGDKELAIEREKTDKELAIEREKTARADKELAIEREKTDKELARLQLELRLAEIQQASVQPQVPTIAQGPNEEMQTERIPQAEPYFFERGKYGTFNISLIQYFPNSFFA